MSNSLQPHEPQHARPPCPSPTPKVHPNPYPLSRWCHPTISSSAMPFSSCPQSFPASGSFPKRQFFASSGQSIGVSASTSVLPLNIMDWFPLEWTGWISLQSKGLSRVFSNTTVQSINFLVLKTGVLFARMDEQPQHKVLDRRSTKAMLESVLPSPSHLLIGLLLLLLLFLTQEGDKFIVSHRELLVKVSLSHCNPAGWTQQYCRKHFISFYIHLFNDLKDMKYCHFP